jgi:prepilin peptidase CpaA
VDVSIPLIASFAIVTVAMLTDSTRGIIPNRLTVPAIALGILAGGIGGGLAGLGNAALGAVLGGALMALPFIWGGMGAGDVKLMIALGAWVGPQVILPIFVYSAFLGGFIGLVLLLRSQGLAPIYLALTGSWKQLLERDVKGPSFPYAICMWFGVVASAMAVRA